MWFSMVFLRKMIFITYCVVISTILPIVTGSFLFLVILRIKEGGNNFDQEEREIFEYKSVQWNPSTDTTSIGFITTFKELKEGNDFLTSTIGDEYLMISNLGVDSYYRCTGSCYCVGDEQEQRRMGSGSAVGKGLTTLLSAASVIFAVKIAKDVFSDDCIEQYSESCGTTGAKVMSEVDGCQPISSESSSKQVSDENDPTSRKFQYLCKGHCMYNKEHMKIAEESGNFWAEDEFEFDKFAVREEGKKTLTEECAQITATSIIEISSYQSNNEKPERVFKKSVLAPLCYHAGTHFWNGVVEEIEEIVSNDPDQHKYRDNKNQKVHDWSDVVKKNEGGGGEVKKGSDDDFHSLKWDRYSHCTDANPPEYFNPTIKCVKQ